MFGLGRRHLLALVLVVAVFAGCTSADDGDANGTTTTADDTDPGDTTPGDTQPADDSPIRLGIVAVDPTAIGEVFGADNAPPDIFELDVAFVEHLNANDGIGGREIVPLYVGVDIGADQNVEGQRACESLTQDAEVDIVLTREFPNEVFLECMNDNGIAVFDLSRFTPDEPYLDQFPNLFLPVAMSGERLIAGAIEASVAEGVLDSDATLGVLYEECDWGSRVYENVVVPRAEQHGFAVTSATFKCIENLVADLGPVSEATQSSVLRFNSEGVTHVLVFTAAEGFIVSQFSNAAAEQQWEPAHIITTSGFPFNNSSLPDANISFADAALPRMTGVGYAPFIDLGDQAEDDQTAVRDECDEVSPDTVADIAADPEGGKWQAFDVYYTLCDTYRALQGALEASDMSFSIADLTDGYQSWIADATSASRVGGRFGAEGSRAAVGFVAPFAYDTGAERFLYTGDPFLAS